VPTSELLQVRGVCPSDGQPIVVDVQDGRIQAVRTEPHQEPGWLSTGLIDLQINGFGGHDLNGPTLTVESVQALAHVLLRAGVTTFAPTLITASEPQLVHALATIQQARNRHPVLAHMIPYAHVEGPSISPEDGPRGAHPAAHVRAPSLAEFARWQAASDGLVGLVTLSPHWPGSADYIRGLKAAGVHVAIGHTDASAAQITEAVDAGASLSTHLGNGSHAMINRRHNALWPQLADDRLCASFIADGHHLASDLLTVMLRAKGLERSLIVSDATALGGMAPGHYDASIGGAVILRADGHLGMDDGTGQYLAGAALPLIAGIPTLVHQAGLAFADALKLATLHPGRWVGGRGHLTPGQPADLVRFTWDGSRAVPRVTDVWLRGDKVV
jgi:N-acetylglucosamine-6-phosphate deacetylase